MGSEVGSESNESKMATYKVSTGRGGAGNIQSTSSKLSPKLVPQGSQTPSILQPVFSTGRGGAGNMRRNVDAKLTRKAQDVDHDEEEDFIEPHGEDDYIEPLSGDNIERALSGAVSSREHVQKVRSKRNSTVEERPSAIAVGRGGAGNIITPTASRKAQAKKKGAQKANKKGVWSSFKKLFS